MIIITTTVIPALIVTMCQEPSHVLVKMDIVVMEKLVVVSSFQIFVIIFVC